MATYALLLRGVNVGGRGLLPMATLRAVLTDVGYDDVRTYLQSGNAVVTCTMSDKTCKRSGTRSERSVGIARGRNGRRH